MDRKSLDKLSAAPKKYFAVVLLMQQQRNFCL